MWCCAKAYPVWIGVAGMTLIVAAWLVGLGEIPPPKLSLLYAVGSALLTVHSLTIGDAVFTTLNLASTFLAVANVIRWLKSRQSAKNKIRKRTSPL